MDYEKLDYLPTLSTSDIESSTLLRFSPDLSTGNNGNWNNFAQHSTDNIEGEANSHIFTLRLTEGNTYNFISYSLTEPTMLRLFDSFGTTITFEDNRNVNSFGLISDYVAPYTGTYYLDASWRDGYSSQLFLIRAEEDIYLSNDLDKPLSVNPNYIAEYTYTGSSDSEYSFSYRDTNEQVNTQDNYFELIDENSSSLLGGVGSGNTVMGAKPFLSPFIPLDTIYYFNHSIYEVTITNPLSSDSQLNKVITFQDGTDFISDIERIAFKDSNLAIDLNTDQRAGSALALFYAAFDALPDKSDFGYWVSVADETQDINSKNDTPRIESLANSMISYYAPDGVSNEVLVNLLFENIMDHKPTSTDTATYVEQINNGTHTQASFFAMAAESSLNQEQYVGLVGQGLEYDEYDSKIG